MNSMRRVALSLLGLTLSCSDAVGPRQQVSDLEAARQRWQAQDLHTYAFTIQRSCFCVNIHPLYVVVLRDTVAGVLDLATGETVDRQLGETVDGLFTLIQSAIDRPAERIQVVYDPAKGFPSQIDYDGA